MRSPWPAIDGRYFTIDGDTQTRPWQPIQPRTVISLSTAGTVARGVLVEDASYDVADEFDPVVTRLVTETTAVPLWAKEPVYDVRTWRPTRWQLVNTVRQPFGLEQQLVVTPAQYRAVTESRGVLRRMTRLRYTIYYGRADGDSLPPSVWRLETMPASGAGEVDLDVEITDLSGVARAVALYTEGDGEWHAVELTSGSPDGHWRGQLPATRGLEYLVQAVDTKGNVATADERGRYFTVGTRQLYLPSLRREPRSGPEMPLRGPGERPGPRSASDAAGVTASSWR